MIEAVNKIQQIIKSIYKSLRFEEITLHNYKSVCEH